MIDDWKYMNKWLRLGSYSWDWMIYLLAKRFSAALSLAKRLDILAITSSQRKHKIQILFKIFPFSRRSWLTKKILVLELTKIFKRYLLKTSLILCWIKFKNRQLLWFKTYFFLLIWDSLKEMFEPRCLNPDTGHFYCKPLKFCTKRGSGRRMSMLWQNDEKSIEQNREYFKFLIESRWITLFSISEKLFTFPFQT